MEPYVSDHFGYKDPKLEKLAEENRKILYNLDTNGNRPIDKYTTDERINLGNIMDKNTKILERYLKENYSDNFKIHTFNYKEDLPKFGESMNIENSPEAKKIWNNVVLPFKDKIKIHNIVKVGYPGTQHMNMSKKLIYFIDESGIYVSSSPNQPPDEFYNFMERMGLTNFNIYEDYKGQMYNYYKWPRVSSLTKQKL